MNNRKFDFQDFVENIPEDGIVGIRISDDVLESEDWGIALLRISAGIVIDQKTICEGVYELPNMIGVTTDTLQRWSCYDGTGSHPCNFHEIIGANIS